MIVKIATVILKQVRRVGVKQATSNTILLFFCS